MNIIIAGNGKVGTTLARRLAEEGYNLTLIDSNADVLADVCEEFDVLGVQGNCASMPVLQQAGVADADLLIAATSQDEVNLLCCTTAHGLNANLHTMLMSNHDKVMQRLCLLFLGSRPARHAMMSRHAYIVVVEPAGAA
jgi:Trk K+ transport system NAD-binding subunit